LRDDKRQQLLAFLLSLWFDFDADVNQYLKTWKVPGRSAIEL